MRTHRSWLAAAVVAYAAVDVVRRFFAAERWLLVAVDLLLVATLAVYLFHEHRWSRLGRHGSVAVFAAGVVASVVLLGALNPWWIDVTTTLAGLRSYLLPMPFLLVGYHAATSWRDEERLSAARFFLVLAGVAIALAVYQLSTDYQALTGVAALLLTPLEHAVHSFGSEAIQLTSSFFASSKRFGRFLFFSFVLVWGFRREQGRRLWPLYPLFLVGIVASGSREALVVFVTFVAATWLVFGRRRLLVGWAAAAVLAALVAVGVSGTARVGVERWSRTDFLLSLSEPADYPRRVRMLFPLDRVDLSAERVLFGHGVGKYGQEAQLAPEIYNVTHEVGRTMFRPLPFFGGAYDFADSGMTKTLVEVGVAGTLLILAGLGVLLWMVGAAAVRAARERRHATFATALAAFAWVLLAAKVHPVLSDAMAGAAFWFCVGFTVRGLDEPPAAGADADAPPEEPTPA